MINKLLVILGPTATGKTNFALKLAKKFNGEVISCDSRQVYKGLDIGTGKMPEGDPSTPRLRRVAQDGYWIIDGVRIWIYDVVDPKEQYSVADYVRDAGRVIRKIRENGKLPIIVGGTGLYLRALVDGLANLAMPVDQILRKQLEKLSKEELQEKLQRVFIKRWERMNQSDRENPRRLIRAIELSTPHLIIRLPRPFGARNDILRIGLTAPRDILYQRVDEGVVNRINQGMVEEAENLYEHGLSLKRMRQLGLEYGVLADYLDGEIKNIEELIKIMQNKIHGYVRRQLTWFKKEKDVNWFDIESQHFHEDVENAVAKWYHPS